MSCCFYRCSIRDCSLLRSTHAEAAILAPRTPDWLQNRQDRRPEPPPTRQGPGRAAEQPKSLSRILGGLDSQSETHVSGLIKRCLRGFFWPDAAVEDMMDRGVDKAATSCSRTCKSALHVTVVTDLPRLELERRAGLRPRRRTFLLMDCRAFFPNFSPNRRPKHRS